MKILTNITSDKKDIVKAGNAMTMFKDVKNETITMVGLIIFEKEEVDEKTGELNTVTVSAVKQANGEFITSISPTVRNSLELIVATYSEEEILNGVDVVVKSKTSNGGREFIYMDLV